MRSILQEALADLASDDVSGFQNGVYTALRTKLAEQVRERQKIVYAEGFDLSEREGDYKGWEGVAGRAYAGMKNAKTDDERLKHDTRLRRASTKMHQVAKDASRGPLERGVRKLASKAKGMFAKSEEYEPVDEDKWIQHAVKRPGALTRKAKRAGETPAEFAQQHKHDSGLTGQQARFATAMQHIRSKK